MKWGLGLLSNKWLVNSILIDIMTADSDMKNLCSEVGVYTACCEFDNDEYD